MKILLTGANGYIGTRLLPHLIAQGHEVFALVRSASRFHTPGVHVIEADLLNRQSLDKIPDEIDAAYYLAHSMAHSASRFTELEALSAKNFRDRISRTRAQQVIYLSGLSNEEHLSPHLFSRKNVDHLLRQGATPVTTLMAGIIIGSGSASFEIIRDLVEKLPIMVAPRWLNNLTQPISILNVLEYLILVLHHPLCIGKKFEIGGPDVLSYKELLLRFARVRALKRWIFTVPVLTPKLSSYWLYFVTSASFPLAQALVESLKTNAVCKETSLQTLFPFKLFTFEEAVRKAFQVIEEDQVPSSWKDAYGDSPLCPDPAAYTTIPQFGIFSDRQTVHFSIPLEEVKNRVFSLGGDRGWLYMNWAWSFRGFLDKLVGGIGLRRGRTHPTRVQPGDALDFWRVVIADEQKSRLLLYAEMKVPGEAWLEFVMTPEPSGGILRQTATFRPRGVLGRLYWYLLFPIHWLIFRGMAQAICQPEEGSL